MQKGKTLKDYPEILKQWNYKMNGSIDPLSIAPRSNKKYYWTCDKCHQTYLATPDTKTARNYGCPVCSNFLVVKGVNDFESCNPELMKDWDYSKNTNIIPSILSKRSLTSVYWKCHKCGHEWKGKIRDATEKKINCPICSQKAKAHARHLYELNKNGCLTDEELIKDWDYSKNEMTPSEVTPCSNIYIYWKCHKCGHEWKAKLSNRVNGRGCPLCSNKVVVPGRNDLATTHPELANEWHPTRNGSLKPTDVTYGMRNKVWWLCPLGHEYQATILHRGVGVGTNCPICNSGRQTSFREQAIYFYIKKLYPNVISRYKPNNFGSFELDIYIPSINIAIEYDGVAWHKENKFEREKRKYLLCKEAGIKLIRIKEKMPEKLGLDIADEIISSDDFESEKGLTLVIHQILKRLYFKGFYYLHPLDVNLSRDRFEIMKYATIIKHSFADEFPDKAKEWHPTKNGTLKPTMFKPKSDFKAWWLCPECGNEYETSLNIRAEGTGCPKCSRKHQIITNRMNQIKKKGSISNKLLLEEWDYEKNGDLKPTQFLDTSNEKVWWKCKTCGYEWQSRIQNRNKGTKCPKCSGIRLFEGENDFASVHPDLLKEWDYTKNRNLDPHKLHHGTSLQVWWKCSKCGYEYKAPIARRDKGSGCRKCADKANPSIKRATLIKKSGSLGDICPYLITEYSPENVLSIFEIVPNSNQKVKWECSICGNKWEAAPSTRKKGSGCPICGRKKAAESRRKRK